MSAFQLEIKNKSIAILTFDLPNEKVNKITQEAGRELERILKDLERNTQIEGLILISGKENIFIAGADINEILAIKTEKEGYEKSNRAQRLPTLLEAMPFPTIAAIDGACLGGGLELVLGFTYRIATDSSKTQIGLPEVSLGILPGMGGCYRLPKTIGLQAALDMILGAKVWPAKKCLKTRLVHEVVPQHILLKRAIEVIEKGIWEKAKGLEFSFSRLLLEKNRLGRNMIYKKAKSAILSKTHGHYPAPLKALDVIYEGLDRGITDALHVESQGFSELAKSDICKNLIGLFFQREATKKLTGVSNPDIRPKKIKAAAVVGSGIMGAGIAQLFSFRNIPVRLKDTNTEAVAKGLSTIRKIYDDLLKKKKITFRELEQKMFLIGPSTEYWGFKKSDIVVEAIVEDLSIKQKVFSTLESFVTHETILASNTSSLSISEIAAQCQFKERVIGMHFFNPVYKMPLVEVIVDPMTSDQTIATTVELVKHLGKVPVVVQNSPGFLVNRILMPYINEAAYLLAEGIPISLIDDVMLDFGMPMGPFTLLDEVGIDVAQKVAHILHKAFGDRVKPHMMMDRVVQAGFYGKKNGKGFYTCPRESGDPSKEAKKENQTLYSLIGIRPRPQESVNPEWETRMVMSMVNEALLSLSEKIVSSVEELDMAMIFGIGFPPFRGGLLKYAHSLGLEKVYTELDILHRKYGERFKPAPYLIHLIETKQRLYAD